MSAVVELPMVALGLLADTGIKATVVLAAAGLAALALRGRSAAVRHALWGSAFAAVPLLAGAALARRGGALTLDVSSLWLLAWAVGVLVALAPLAGGLLRLHAARRGGTLEGTRDGTLDGAVVWTDAVDVPLTYARTILMPARARAWSPAEQRAARLHELAHLRRGDWWVHAGAWLVCALLWFHPLVWWARRRLCLEAERAADDRVLAAGIVPSAYARQLLQLARGPAAGLSMGRSVTSTRVRAVLDAVPRGGRRWPVVALSLGIGLLAAPSLSAWAIWTPPPTAIGCQPAELLP